MCISAARAEFTGTKGYIGEATKDGKTVHVLGYQNDAKNLHDGGNALILPFPTSELMGEENVIKLGDKGKNVLNHLVDKYFAPREMSRGLMLKSATNSASVRIFQSGIYQVAISEKPSLINAALEKIDADKRPQIHPDLLQWYEDYYPGWTIAVCCFSNKDKQQAEPLFWWYTPSNEKELFFPAMDAHTGGLPDLSINVSVDHKILMGSDKLEEGGPALTLSKWELEHYYLPENIDLLPKRIVGRRFWGKLKNGDFKIQADALRKHRRQDFLRFQKDTVVEAPESETHMAMMDEFETPTIASGFLGIQDFLAGKGSL